MRNVFTFSNGASMGAKTLKATGMTLTALFISFIGVLPLAAHSQTGTQSQGTYVSLDPRYHLTPGDLLEIDFRLSPEFNATVPIQPDGFITLPNVGDVKVAGLTLEEATKKIKERASELLNDPPLTVELKQFDSPYFIVGGQVNTPGRVQIKGRMTILSAIQLAGGFKDGANTRQVIVIHALDETRAKTTTINYRRIVRHYQPADDIEIHAGDLIFVPQNGVTEVTPYIKLIAFGFYFNPLDF
jgi:polysaccharide export outer membrane protein